MAKVGVLAVQGDFAEHQAALDRLGVDTVQVRRPADLVGLTGLVLPGGESSTMLRLLDLQGLTEPLRAAIAGGLPTLATCAGLILLARQVEQPVQRSLGILDLAVARNGYGRQIHSGSVELRAAAELDILGDGRGDSLGDELGQPPLQGIFIRAPRILRVGAGMQVLAWRGEDPVWVQQGAISACCFHPELQVDHLVTRMFAARAGADSCARSG